MAASCPAKNGFAYEGMQQGKRGKRIIHTHFMLVSAVILCVAKSKMLLQQKFKDYDILTVDCPTKMSTIRYGIFMLDWNKFN